MHSPLARSIDPRRPNPAHSSGPIVLLCALLFAGAASAAPVISVIPNQSSREDTVIGPIAFTIGDATTPATQLRLSAASTAPGLIPVSAISFGGSGSNRTVTFLPLTNAFGSATVTIIVSNATEFASRAFTVQVNAVNDPPTLDPILDQALLTGGGSVSVFLSGISSGAANEPQILSVTVVSNSNPALFVGSPFVSYSSPAQSGFLNLQPVFNAGGAATLAVQVNDNGTSNNTVRREFRVVVTNNLVDLNVWSAFASPNPAGVSNVLTYNYRIFNNGPSNATGVVFTSVLPTNVVFLSVTTAGVSNACSHAGGIVTCRFPTLGRFRQVPVRLLTLPVAEGTASNFISVTAAQLDRYPSDNTLPIVVPVIRATDLALSGPELPPALLVGGDLTFTLQVTNHGVLTATNARTSLYVSENVQLLSVVSSLGGCSNGPTDALCSLGNFPPGAPARITVTARAQRAGEVSMSGYAFSDTPEAQFNNNNWSAISVAALTLLQSTSAAPVQIPAQGTASPYPSTLLVSGATARVQRVTVTLHGLTHPAPADLDVLLVGPTGRSVLLLSDFDSPDGATKVTLTFDDAFPQLPFGDSIVSGRYSPTDNDDVDPDDDSFPPPAPAGPPWGLLDVFRNTNPNGVWSLYVRDDSSAGAGGVLAGGWSLTVAAGDRSLAEPATLRVLAGANSSAGIGSADFRQLGRPVINAAGQTAFLADRETLSPDGGTEFSSAVWTTDAPGQLRKLAGDRDAAPGFGTNGQFQIETEFGPPPALNDSGRIGFNAAVFDPEDGLEQFSIWSGVSSNDLVHLAVTDDLAPVDGEDWFFVELSRPFLSESGVVAFRGRAQSDFLPDSVTGYWLGSSRSNLALLAGFDQRAPGVDGVFGEIPEIDFSPPILDASGRLAFRATANTDDGEVAGVWIGASAQDLRLVALGGMTVPGLPSDMRLARSFDSWQVVGIDDAGRVYFRAEVESDFSSPFTGIFAGTGPADVELLFRTDTPVFVGAIRVVFQTIFCPVVAANGEVIFTAEFNNQVGETITGLWKGRGVDDLRLVAYNGQPLPYISATATLQNLFLECPVRGVNRFGRFVFRAGVEDIPGDFFEALFAYDPAAGLVPLARSGDIIEVAPGDFRRMFDFSSVAGADDFNVDRSGGRQAFNAADELVFRAEFDDGLTSIIIAQLGSASVEGDVWYDRTANAVLDTGEPGVPQTRVDLFSPGADGQPSGGDDVLVASRLTDANGHYRLGTMTAGQYFLQFTPPPGFGFVARDQGGNDARDSDADPATGRTALFTLGATTRDTTRSAGLVSGFTVVDAATTEGDTGMRQMTVTVALGAPRRFPVSVNYSTEPGTATSGVDFTPTSGRLYFNPGEAAKGFTVFVAGDTLPENDESVLVNLSSPDGAPIVRGQGVGRIVNDDPVPPPPSQPQPLHRSVLQPLNVDLSWSLHRTRELLTNGGFELGSFAGWTVEPAGSSNSAGFFLGDDPLGAPEGRYFAASSEDTFQPRILSRRVTLPAQLVSARLRWWQSFFAPDGIGGNRQFRVEVRDEFRQTLAVVYQARPGDDVPDWDQTSANLLPFAGRRIEIAFIVESPAFSFRVSLDDIRVEVDDTAGTTFDVYFGASPVPGAAQFRGNTAQTFWPAPSLSPLTTYYWQIVARRGEAAVPGPVWHFTTRRNATNDFAYTFSSFEEIVIPDFGDDGRAWTYPSTITVRNLPGAVAKATVTLHGLSHSYPEDLDILLVGPDGRHTLLLSDAGGSNAVAGLTLTLDEAAPAPVPQAGPLRSGVFRSADYAAWPDDFPPPAPAGPHPASLARFGETKPNGNWALYVFDGFSFEDGGAIAEGWSLSLTLLQADSDADGLPDDYEIANELNPLNRLDARRDSDQDGHTLAQEYAAGTDPENPESLLRIRRFHFEGDDAVLEFSAGVNRDFRIERLAGVTGPATVIAELPGSDDWLTVRDFGARRLPRAFYRVRAVPSAAPFDPEFPPGPEYFRAQATPLTNTAFARLFAVFEDGFSQEALVSRPSADTFVIEGRAGNSGNGSFAERFQITLPGVVAPGQFTVTSTGPASAVYLQAPFPGPPFAYATILLGDGGTVAIDSLTNGYASGRFNLILSDTADAARKIRANGSFRAFVE